MPSFIIGLFPFGTSWFQMEPYSHLLVGEHLHRLSCPSLALAIPVFAQVTRFFRGQMIETLSSDYIQLATAKG